MFRRIAVFLCTLALAFGILTISIFRTASIKYQFAQFNSQVLAQTHEDMEIDYTLPYPGAVLPDHPLWSIKVLRDKAWLLLTTDSEKKAELNLLFSDKRLAASKILFEKGKAELAFSTLTKAEKYLEQASSLEKENREKGTDTSYFLTKLANCSLIHRHTINQIIPIAPEDARPKIIQVEDYSKRIYKDARDALLAKGITPPENPFNGD